MLLVALCLSRLGSPDAPQGSEQDATAITYPEAEILVYITPQAQRVRAEGFDVGWDHTISARLNQTDYFFFYLFNSKRRSSGSVTVGNYAVNKHTGDVWDQTEEKLLRGAELEGVQKILRDQHRITEQVILEFRSRPLYPSATQDPR